MLGPKGIQGEATKLPPEPLDQPGDVGRLAQVLPSSQIGAPPADDTGSAPPAGCPQLTSESVGGEKTAFPLLHRYMPDPRRPRRPPCAGSEGTPMGSLKAKPAPPTFTRLIRWRLPGLTQDAVGSQSLREVIDMSLGAAILVLCVVANLLGMLDRRLLIPEEGRLVPASDAQLFLLPCPMRVDILFWQDLGILAFSRRDLDGDRKWS